MKQQRKSRWLISSTGAVIFAAAFLLCGYGGLLGDSRTDIDVNSGHLRTRVFVLGVPVSTTVIPTPFSEAVETAGLSAQPADYRLTYGSTIGPQRLFGTSHTCTAYGDAFASLKLLCKAFEMFPALKENEREILAESLRMLQAGDRKGVNQYVNELVDPLLDAAEAKSKYSTDGLDE